METKADNNPAPKQNSVDDTSAKSSKSETLSNNKNSNKDLAETKSELIMLTLINHQQKKNIIK